LLRFFAAPPSPSAAPAAPYLRDANGRLGDWRRNGDDLRFTLSGHMPLVFSLSGAGHCSVSSRGITLKPLGASGNTQTFGLSDAAATIETRCRRH